MCEKAVKLDNGNIILFYLTCDMITNGVIWEPYFEPYYAFSKDNGVSFTEAKPLFDKRGRIYDVLYKDGTLYILFFANPELPGKAHSEEYDLELYISSDNGNTFEFRSKLPFDTMINCYYGTMEFTKTGTLIAYTYCDKDEFHLKYVISTDNGITWSENRFAFFKKKLRNPQLIRYNDLFFIHGRGGDPKEFYGSLMLYSSADGINWDDGQYLCYAKAGLGAYSNNFLIHMPNGQNRLMIHSSQAYEKSKTNVIMFFIDLN
jgi:hypothetical protein